MNAVNQGIAVLHRAQAITGYGDVFLESRYEDAVRVTVQALNEYDALVGACEAHMVWKRHVEDCLTCGMRLKCSVERELQARSDELAEDALGLVRGEVSDG